LSLVAAGGTSTRATTCILQEVRNPNGIFNSVGPASSPTRHFFDYAPDAYVKLNAGNAVSLLGGAVPRKSGLFEQGIPSLYAPSLDITAGAGGVTIANHVVLFPSPVGQLHLTTTAADRSRARSPAISRSSSCPTAPGSNTPRRKRLVRRPRPHAAPRQ